MSSRAKSHSNDLAQRVTQNLGHQSFNARQYSSISRPALFSPASKQMATTDQNGSVPLNISRKLSVLVPNKPDQQPREPTNRPKSPDGRNNRGPKQHQRQSHHGTNPRSDGNARYTTHQGSDHHQNRQTSRSEGPIHTQHQQLGTESTQPSKNLTPNDPEYHKLSHEFGDLPSVVPFRSHHDVFRMPHAEDSYGVVPSHVLQYLAQSIKTQEQYEQHCLTVAEDLGRIYEHIQLAKPYTVITKQQRANTRSKGDDDEHDTTLSSDNDSSEQSENEDGHDDRDRAHGTDHRQRVRGSTSSSSKSSKEKESIFRLSPLIGASQVNPTLFSDRQTIPKMLAYFLQKSLLHTRHPHRITSNAVDSNGNRFDDVYNRFIWPLCRLIVILQEPLHENMLQPSQIHSQIYELALNILYLSPDPLNPLTVSWVINAMRLDYVIPSRSMISLIIQLYGKTGNVVSFLSIFEACLRFQSPASRAARAALLPPVFDERNYTTQKLRIRQQHIANKIEMTKKPFSKLDTIDDQQQSQIGPLLDPETRNYVILPPLNDIRSYFISSNHRQIANLCFQPDYHILSSTILACIESNSSHLIKPLLSAYEQHVPDAYDVHNHGALYMNILSNCIRAGHLSESIDFIKIMIDKETPLTHKQVNQLFTIPAKHAEKLFAMPQTTNYGYELAMEHFRTILYPETGIKLQNLVPFVNTTHSSVVNIQSNYLANQRMMLYDDNPRTSYSNRNKLAGDMRNPLSWNVTPTVKSPPPGHIYTPTGYIYKNIQTPFISHDSMVHQSDQTYKPTSRNVKFLSVLVEYLQMALSVARMHQVPLDINTMTMLTKFLTSAGLHSEAFQLNLLAMKQHLIPSQFDPAHRLQNINTNPQNSDENPEISRQAGTQQSIGQNDRMDASQGQNPQTLGDVIRSQQQQQLQPQDGRSSTDISRVKSQINQQSPYNNTLRAIIDDLSSSLELYDTDYITSYPQAEYIARLVRDLDLVLYRQNKSAMESSNNGGDGHFLDDNDNDQMDDMDTPFASFKSDFYSTEMTSSSSSESTRVEETSSAGVNTGSKKQEKDTQSSSATTAAAATTTKRPNRHHYHLHFVEPEILRSMAIQNTALESTIRQGLLAIDDDVHDRIYEYAMQQQQQFHHVKNKAPIGQLEYEKTIQSMLNEGFQAKLVYIIAMTRPTMLLSYPFPSPNPSGQAAADHDQMEYHQSQPQITRVGIDDLNIIRTKYLLDTITLKPHGTESMPFGMAIQYQQISTLRVFAPQSLCNSQYRKSFDHIKRLHQPSLHQGSDEQQQNDDTIHTPQHPYQLIHHVSSEFKSASMNYKLSDQVDMDITPLVSISSPADAIYFIRHVHQPKPIQLLDWRYVSLPSPDVTSISSSLLACQSGLKFESLKVIESLLRFQRVMTIYTRAPVPQRSTSMMKSTSLQEYLDVDEESAIYSPAFEHASLTSFTVNAYDMFSYQLKQQQQRYQQPSLNDTADSQHISMLNHVKSLPPSATVTAHVHNDPVIIRVLRQYADLHHIHYHTMGLYYVQTNDFVKGRQSIQQYKTTIESMLGDFNETGNYVELPGAPTPPRLGIVPHDHPVYSANQLEGAQQSNPYFRTGRIPDEYELVMITYDIPSTHPLRNTMFHASLTSVIPSIFSFTYQAPILSQMARMFAHALGIDLNQHHFLAHQPTHHHSTQGHHSSALPSTSISPNSTLPVLIDAFKAQPFYKSIAKHPDLQRDALGVLASFALRLSDQTPGFMYHDNVYKTWQYMTSPAQHSYSHSFHQNYEHAQTSTPPTASPSKQHHHSIQEFFDVIQLSTGNDFHSQSSSSLLDGTDASLRTAAGSSHHSLSSMMGQLTLRPLFFENIYSLSLYSPNPTALHDDDDGHDDADISSRSGDGGSDRDDDHVTDRDPPSSSSRSNNKTHTISGTDRLTSLTPYAALISKFSGLTRLPKYIDEVISRGSRRRHQPSSHQNKDKTTIDASGYDTHTKYDRANDIITAKQHYDGYYDKVTNVAARSYYKTRQAFRDSVAFSQNLPGISSLLTVNEGKLHSTLNEIGSTHRIKRLAVPLTFTTPTYNQYTQYKLNTTSYLYKAQQRQLKKQQQQQQQLQQPNNEDGITKLSHYSTIVADLRESTSAMQYRRLISSVFPIGIEDSNVRLSQRNNLPRITPVQSIMQNYTVTQGSSRFNLDLVQKTRFQFPTTTLTQVHSKDRDRNGMKKILGDMDTTHPNSNDSNDENTSTKQQGQLTTPTMNDFAAIAATVEGDTLQHFYNTFTSQLEQHPTMIYDNFHPPQHESESLILNHIQSVRRSLLLENMVLISKELFNMIDQMQYEVTIDNISSLSSLCTGRLSDNTPTTDIIFSQDTIDAMNRRHIIHKYHNKNGHQQNHMGDIHENNDQFMQDVLAGTLHQRRALVLQQAMTDVLRDYQNTVSDSSRSSNDNTSTDASNPEHPSHISSHNSLLPKHLMSRQLCEVIVDILDGTITQTKIDNYFPHFQPPSSTIQSVSSTLPVIRSALQSRSVHDVIDSYVDEDATNMLQKPHIDVNSIPALKEDGALSPSSRALRHKRIVDIISLYSMVQSPHYSKLLPSAVKYELLSCLTDKTQRRDLNSPIPAGSSTMTSGPTNSGILFDTLTPSQQKLLQNTPPLEPFNFTKKLIYEIETSQASRLSRLLFHNTIATRLLPSSRVLAVDTIVRLFHTYRLNLTQHIITGQSGKLYSSHHDNPSIPSIYRHIDLDPYQGNTSYDSLLISRSESSTLKHSQHYQQELAEETRRAQKRRVKDDQNIIPYVDQFPISTKNPRNATLMSLQSSYILSLTRLYCHKTAMKQLYDVFHHNTIPSATREEKIQLLGQLFHLWHINGEYNNAMETFRHILHFDGQSSAVTLDDLESKDNTSMSSGKLTQSQQQQQRLHSANSKSTPAFDNRVLAYHIGLDGCIQLIKTLKYAERHVVLDDALSVLLYTRRAHGKLPTIVLNETLSVLEHHNFTAEGIDLFMLMANPQYMMELIDNARLIRPMDNSAQPSAATAVDGSDKNRHKETLPSSSEMNLGTQSSLYHDIEVIKPQTQEFMKKVRSDLLKQIELDHSTGSPSSINILPNIISSIITQADTITTNPPKGQHRHGVPTRQDEQQGSNGDKPRVHRQKSTSDESDAIIATDIYSISPRFPLLTNFRISPMATPDLSEIDIDNTQKLSNLYRPSSFIYAFAKLFHLRDKDSQPTTAANHSPSSGRDKPKPSSHDTTPSSRRTNEKYTLFDGINMHTYRAIIDLCATSTIPLTSLSVQVIKSLLPPQRHDFFTNQIDYLQKVSNAASASSSSHENGQDPTLNENNQNIPLARRLALMGGFDHLNYKDQQNMLLSQLYSTIEAILYETQDGADPIYNGHVFINEPDAKVHNRSTGPAIAPIELSNTHNNPTRVFVIPFLHRHITEEHLISLLTMISNYNTKLSRCFDVHHQHNITRILRDLVQLTEQQEQEQEQQANQDEQDEMTTKNKHSHDHNDDLQTSSSPHVKRYSVYDEFVKLQSLFDAEGSEDGATDSELSPPTSDQTHSPREATIVNQQTTMKSSSTEASSATPSTQHSPLIRHHVKNIPPASNAIRPLSFPTKEIAEKAVEFHTLKLGLQYQVASLSKTNPYFNTLAKHSTVLRVKTRKHQTNMFDHIYAYTNPLLWQQKQQYHTQYKHQLSSSIDMLPYMQNNHRYSTFSRRRSSLACPSHIVFQRHSHGSTQSSSRQYTMDLNTSSLPTHRNSSSASNGHDSILM